MLVAATIVLLLASAAHHFYLLLVTPLPPHNPPRHHCTVSGLLEIVRPLPDSRCSWPELDENSRGSSGEVGEDEDEVNDAGFGVENLKTLDDKDEK